MAELVDKNILKTLVPPSALNAENFQELAKKAVVQSLASGRSLFRAGDMDRKTIYVLSGDVELSSEKGGTKIITGGTEAARHPLANQQPRQVSAKAKSAITYTSFDSDLLDILLTWDQLSGIEVSEITVEDKYDIDIPLNVLSETRTMNDLIKVVQDRISGA